jgi:hypothetical protein
VRQQQSQPPRLSNALNSPKHTFKNGGCRVVGVIEQPDFKKFTESLQFCDKAIISIRAKKSAVNHVIDFLLTAM